MIAETVTTQADVFLISMAWAAGLFALYDVLRGLRRAVRHWNFFVALEDFLYWMFWTCCVIYMIYTYNNGEIRSYVLLGFLLGAVLYELLLSRLILFLLAFLMKKIVFAIGLLFRLLLAPVKYCRKHNKSIEKNWETS